MSYIKLIINIVFWLFGFLMLWKIPFCKNICISKNNSFFTFSIIIPARNEAKNLPNLLDSLQYLPASIKEIIIVDDNSTDTTLEAIKKYNTRIIRLDGLPPGWTGKSWACYNGAKVASGDYLLFLDADTKIVDNGLQHITSSSVYNSGVTSIQPYHKIQKFYENLSMFFNIILMAGMGSFTPFQTKIKPIGVFGPCMICKKDDYFKIGGHKSIKSKVMEDIEIGKSFLKAGVPVFNLGGKGTINFRMYPNGLKDLINGWVKGFGTGAKSTSIPLLIMIICWIVGSAFPMELFIRGLVFQNHILIIFGVLFYIFYALQIFWMSYRIGNFNLLTPVFYPVSLVFFIAIFFYSLESIFLTKKVNWKGRRIKT
jgi:4,4'-diaponeurosporenoate glycosyltransferase